MSNVLEKPAKGKLLVAEPFLGDASFERTVILLIDYSDNGAVGLVLNRPLDLRMEQLLADFPVYEPKVLYGGPVQHNNLYYLHNKGSLVPESEEILPGLFWGGKISVVRELLNSGAMLPPDIKFFLGYSGWGKVQLSDELTEKSWLIVEPEIDILGINSRTLWKDLLLDLGGDYMLWANAPRDPILN